MSAKEEREEGLPDRRLGVLQGTLVSVRTCYLVLIIYVFTCTSESE